MKLIVGLPPIVDVTLERPQLLTMPMGKYFAYRTLALGPALLVGVLAIIALSGNWDAFTQLMQVNVKSLPPWAFLGSMAAVLVVHELLHALFFPQLLTNPNCILGLIPSKGVGYAWCGVPMTRRRYMLAASAPLMLLSVIPLLLIAVNPAYFGFFIGVAVFNLLGVGGDLMTIYAVMRKVPKRGHVQGSGMKLYWSEPAT